MRAKACGSERLFKLQSLSQVVMHWFVEYIHAEFLQKEFFTGFAHPVQPQA